MKLMNAIESAETWARGYISGQQWADDERVAQRIERAAVIVETYERNEK
jgi:hypothetical protein